MFCLVFARFFLCHIYINTKEKKIEYQLTESFSLRLLLLLLHYSIFRSDACSFLPIPFFFQRVIFTWLHKLRFSLVLETCQSRKPTVGKKQEKDSRIMSMCASEHKCYSLLRIFKRQKKAIV